MRWKHYILLVSAIVALRFSDLIITYYYTPNLKYEWNPLVSLFNVSWPGFILTQTAIVLFVSLLMFFYFNRPSAVTALKNLSFADYIYVYFFDKLRPWPNRIFRFPIHWRKHLIFNGYIFMTVTLLISGFAIIHNLLLINRVASYARFVVRHYRLYFPIAFMLMAILSVYSFFIIEYLNYRRAQNRT
jgi:hypothetical protein